MVAFAQSPALINHAHATAIRVDLPLLDSDPLFEVWSTNEPIHNLHKGNIHARASGSLLFARLDLAQAPAQDLEALSFSAYTQIFEFLSGAGYPHLWRIWHYLPDIGGSEHGRERYHNFNLGRHDAFRAQGRAIGDNQVPAACALGTHGEHLSWYFIAGRAPGTAIENPRQTSAYHYPAQYGPRSPTFARAMLTEVSGAQQLFISGTASIVGHASQHPDDIDAQTRETLLNLQTVLSQARGAGLHYPAPGARLTLKVYLHQPAHLSRVRQEIRATFGEVDTLYLQADICRKELLLEIEAFCVSAGAT